MKIVIAELRVIEVEGVNSSEDAKKLPFLFSDALHGKTASITMDELQETLNQEFAKVGFTAGKPVKGGIELLRVTL